MDQGLPLRIFWWSVSEAKEMESVVGSSWLTPVGLVEVQAAYKVALITRGLRILSDRILPISEGVL